MNIKLSINGKLYKTNELDITSLSYQDEVANKSDTIAIEYLKPLIKLKDKVSLLLNKGQRDYRFGVFEIIKLKEDLVNKTYSAEGNFLQGFAKKENRSFSNIEIKNLVSLFASEGKYKYKCNVEHSFSYVAQKSETNIQLLSRLSKTLNAYFAIKDNKLLFLDSKKQYSKSTTIDTKELSSLEMTNSLKKKYSSCRVSFRDTKSNTTKHVTVGSGEPVLQKTAVVNSEDEASAIAKAALGAQKNIAGSCSIYDNSTKMFFAGDRLKFQGIGTSFKITKVSHTITPDNHQMSAEFTI